MIMREKFKNSCNTIIKQIYNKSIKIILVNQGHSIWYTIWYFITDHKLSFNHDFNWENIKILDRERYLGRRLVSEMLQMQNNSRNLQSDTEFLHHAYISILNRL